MNLQETGAKKGHLNARLFLGLITRLGPNIPGTEINREMLGVLQILIKRMKKTNSLGGTRFVPVSKTDNLSCSL